MRRYRMKMLALATLVLSLAVGACGTDPMGPGSSAGLAPGELSAAKGKSPTPSAPPEEDDDSGSVTIQSDFAIAWPD